MAIPRPIGILLLTAGGACAQAPSFTLIPAPLGATTTRAVTAMSADGSTVIGITDTHLDFVWTSAAGSVRPPPLAGGSTTHFRGVSADGSVIVGWGDTGPDWRAFRLTPSGYQVIPPLPGATGEVGVGGVSADGSIVVGWSNSTNPMPWKWTAAGGTQPLPGSWFPLGISSDGAVIMGTAASSSPVGGPLARLTSASPGVVLVPTPSAYHSNYPHAVSADGRFIVGSVAWIGITPYSAPYRWSETGGFEMLRILYRYGNAYATSADGSVSVGLNSLLSTFACAWTSPETIVDLTAYLRSVTTGVPSYPLIAAKAVSGDARTIAGVVTWDGPAWIAHHVDPAFPCFANCDGSSGAPMLDIYDFLCFMQRFAAGDPSANCDGSTALPVLNVADFTCFLQKYTAGCPWLTFW